MIIKNFKFYKVDKVDKSGQCLLLDAKVEKMADFKEKNRCFESGQSKLERDTGVKKMNDYHKQLFDKYSVDLEVIGHRERGADSFRQKVPRFIKYIEDMDLMVNEVRIKHATEYQGYLINSVSKYGEKLKRYSVIAYIVAVKNFYEFLKREKVVYTNPFTELRRIANPNRIPRDVLKEKDMNKFLMYLSNLDKVNTLKAKVKRYKTHIASEIFYSTGLRLSELAYLRIEDIDFTRGIVHVREGKGGIQRVAYLNEYASQVLRIYVEKVRDVIFSIINKENENMLFGIRHYRLQESLMEEFREVCKKLKLPHQTSHKFRHALGAHLLRAGCDIRYIQEILGHKRLYSTEIYTKVEKEDLKKIFDQFHPRKYKKHNEVKKGEKAIA